MLISSFLKIWFIRLLAMFCLYDMARNHSVSDYELIIYEVCGLLIWIAMESKLFIVRKKEAA